MARSDAARTALLDAAERLFAQSGIAQVSDRKVAEAAGNTNHSAVGYYFGGRGGLLRAMVERHLVGLEEPRRAMFERSDSLLGDVRSLVVPVTDALAELPNPSWRARFLSQALHDPFAVPLIREAEEFAPTAALITRSVMSRLDHLDPKIVSGRARLMMRIVSTACADIEARAEKDGQDPQWRVAGNFLSDAIAGMLTAPISH
ncbi:TetR family transcriptional regulator [Streptomyces sp. NPDC059506]|uniref:TetR/AcrR family transcriptional regulator n=1 Tax=Streptomyces TaxID=1883 RepID=UPI000CB6778E|nr:MULTISPECIES: TetR/AcrR family transcriptional regulator [unclassified Streptomyces]MCZ2526133.1 helix-turn-helix domain containing protein [Streptomyces sp. HB2AG]PLW73170.1 TetR family transcriptional regulator [Streptomyces sp. DJ]QMV24271.1 TetR family transcriptional regulator [Streptomyces sp. SCUT-3]